MSSRLLRKSLTGAVAGASVTLANFLGGLVVARMLGVTSTGVVAYVVWLSLLLAPIADLGLPATIERFGAELRGLGDETQARNLASNLLRVLAIPLCIVAAVMALLAALPDVARLSGLANVGATSAQSSEKLLPLLVTAFVTVQVLGMYSYAYLRSRQAFDTAARLAVASLALQVSGIAFGGASFGITGAVAGYICGMILPAIAALRVAGRPARVDKRVSQRVARYARYVWTANVANAFIWSRAEVPFLAHYQGPEAVALFVVALTLTNLAIQGPLLLTGAALPILSEHRGRNDEEAMRHIYATGTRTLALLVFPACLGMAAIMPVLLPLIYGQAFAGAVPTASILVSIAAIAAPSMVATQVIYAMERSDFACLSGLVGAFATILAGFFLVPRFGLLGATVGRSTIQLLMISITTWFVVRRLRYPFPAQELARLFLAATAAALVARLCVDAAPHPSTLALAVPLAVAVYIMALRFLNALPTSDVLMFANFASALPRPLSYAAEALLRFVGRPAMP